MTVEEKWKGFSEATMPKEASDIQTTEMQRSFYAGAFSMFNLILEINTFDEESAAKRLSELEQETEAFFKKGL